MKTVAIYHMKGGVGKTSTAVNIAYLAAAGGWRTLLCDLDPQSSATFFFRVEPKFKSGARGLIKGGEKIEQNIRATNYPNLDVLPADLDFRRLDSLLEDKTGSAKSLKTALAGVKNGYDVVFLDCPPNLTLLSENIFRAADMVIVPVIPTTLSVRSLVQLIKFLREEKFDTSRVYVLFSMVEENIRHQNTMTQTIRHLSGKYVGGVFNRFIPKDGVVERMGLKREPVPVMDELSPAGKAYQAIWKEVLEKL